MVFYRDELRLFEHQLEQLVANQPKHNMPMIEHFQNSFIRQHEVLDELEHEMQLYEDALYEGEEPEPKIIVDVVLPHAVFEEKMQTFIHIYTDLKTEFVDFVNKL